MTKFAEIDVHWIIPPLLKPDRSQRVPFWDLYYFSLLVPLTPSCYRLQWPQCRHHCNDCHYVTNITTIHWVKVSLSILHSPPCLQESLLSFFGINMKFSDEQRAELLRTFDANCYPSKDEKTDIANQIGTTFKRVHKWFTDERRRRKMANWLLIDIAFSIQ